MPFLTYRLSRIARRLRSRNDLLCVTPPLNEFSRVTQPNHIVTAIPSPDSEPCSVDAHDHCALVETGAKYLYMSRDCRYAPPDTERLHYDSLRREAHRKSPRRFATTS